MTNQPMRSIDGIHRQPNSSRKRKATWLRFVLMGIVATLLLELLGVMAFVVVRHLNKPDYDQVSVLTNKLAEHVVLPVNESPILATVTDRSALKTPFLKAAQDGDRVVIYPKAKKVIIYRPSTDRIVDIGPVDVDNIPKVK